MTAQIRLMEGVIQRQTDRKCTAKEEEEETEKEKN